MSRSAHVVLADGTRFEGEAVGAPGVTTGEVVFTTGMTGYQEVLTDPSYCGQIVTMTAPMMGNTGTNAEDDEAHRSFVSGLVVRELSRVSSNWRSSETLADYLTRRGIVALSGVDTRTLTRHIRTAGAQMAAMGTEDVATLHDRALAAPPMAGRNLTDEVTTDRVHEWSEGSGRFWPGARRAAGARVVAVDLGVKRNILRCLHDEGLEVTVVPARTTAAQILSHRPDGVFLSNGPGDPAAVDHAVVSVRDLLGTLPIFGICLGHQILALALGGSTSKLKFGHRGLNQPVKDLATGRIEVTTQNHGFVVDVASLGPACRMTHVHLNDGTCEGIAHAEARAFGVQHHPEASAGPHDSRHLFARFAEAIAGGAPSAHAGR